VKCYSSLVVFQEMNLIHASYLISFVWFIYFYLMLRLRGTSSLFCCYNVVTEFSFVDFIVIFDLIMLKILFAFLFIYLLFNCSIGMFSLSLVWIDNNRLH
jgi:hypothetical protein